LDQYTNKYSDNFIDKYQDKYTNKLTDKYLDKYTNRFSDKWAGGQIIKFKDGLPDLPFNDRGAKAVNKSALTKFSKAYNVEIKKKGKFLTIGSNLSKREAFAKGMRETETTTAATFRLKPINRLVEEKPSGGVPFALFQKYYQKKNQPLTYIEKVKYRINTGGEVKGLKLAKIQKKGRWF
jgi:hypothetical protein